MTTEPNQPQPLTVLELCVKAHANSASKGFWDIRDFIATLPNHSEELMAIFRLSRVALFHEEASEVCGAIRKPQADDHCPELSMEEAELADIMIRVGDYAGGFGIDLERAIRIKMAYNASRPHKHGKLA